MTKDDVRKIFNCENEIEITKSISVSIDDFLNVAGFKDAPDNPTKEDLHAIDQGIKGYAELIDSGNYE